MSRGNARACGLRPLTVRPALTRFQQTLKHEKVAATKVCRKGAQQVVLDALEGADTDSVSAFERVLNGCLDAGYRENGLTAFVYEVLHRRFAGRIRRRLSASSRREASRFACFRLSSSSSSPSSSNTLLGLTYEYSRR